MKKYILFLSLLAICPALSNAQSMYEIKQAIDFFRAEKLQTGEWKQVLTENDIEGSPYLNDDFINGSVYTVMKQQFVDVPLRYNIYNDQVEFKTEDNTVQALAAPEIIEKVEFGENIMVYIPYSYSKKINKGFFVIISEGNTSLYAKPRVIFEEPKEPGAYQDAVPAKFTKKADDYFIRVGPEQAKLVSNKKSLLEIFPEHQKEVEEFVKKNKTRPNNQDDLAALVEYYNTL